MDYKIEKSDTLCGIARKHYKTANGKPISDAEAYKAALKIAECNSIENPDLIYAGDTIQLPKDFDSLFEQQHNQTKQPQEQNIFDKYEQWQKESILKDEAGTPASEIEGFKIVPNYNDDTYIQDMIKFAKQEILTSDGNSSGTIDLDEYKEHELKVYKDTFGEELKLNEQDFINLPTQGAYIMFTGMDTSEDKVVDYEEYAMTTAKLEGYTCTKGNNGEITITDSEGNDKTKELENEFNSISGDDKSISQNDYMQYYANIYNQLDAKYKNSETSDRFNVENGKIIDKENPYKTMEEFTDAVFETIDYNDDNELDEFEIAAYETALDAIDNIDSEVDGKIEYTSLSKNILETFGFKALFENTYSYYQPNEA